MASHRIAQISGIIRTVAATHALQTPPNMATVVSVTDVRVSADLSYADVSVSAITNVEGAIKFLASQKGAMRKELAAKLQSHRVPILRFNVDTEGQRASRIDTLLDSLK